MKNNEALHDTVSKANEHFTDEAQGKGKWYKSKALYPFCAACAVLLVGLFKFAPFLKMQGLWKDPYASVSQTTIAKVTDGGRKVSASADVLDNGVGGLLADDISQLDEKSPWSEGLNLTKMPALKNNSYVEDESGRGAYNAYFGEKEMRSIAGNTARALGVWVYHVDVGMSSFEAEDPETGVTYEKNDVPTSVTAMCTDSTDVTVYGDGSIFISFVKDNMPEQYHFTANDTTDEEAEEVLGYLIKKYSGLMGFKNPKGYTCVDVDCPEKFSRAYYVYDEADDIRESIMNHDIAYVEFYPDENGQLSGIRIENPYCSSEYIGDYPIISADDAREKLLAGEYYSSNPDEDHFKNGTLSPEDVVKVELEYHNAFEKYFIPYYKFYVELDKEKNEEPYEISEGTKLFGLFYVPAVADEYIEMSDNETHVWQ